MPVNPDLLDILVCPETRQSVSLASSELIDQINAGIKSGTLRNRGGNRIEKPIEEALVREDGQVVYVVEDSIPVMLVEESIEL